LTSFRITPKKNKPFNPEMHLNFEGTTFELGFDIVEFCTSL
jgi:hypothetical protein